MSAPCGMSEDQLRFDLLSPTFGTHPINITQVCMHINQWEEEEEDRRTKGRNGNKGKRDSQKKGGEQIQRKERLFGLGSWNIQQNNPERHPQRDSCWHDMVLRLEQDELQGSLSALWIGPLGPLFIWLVSGDEEWEHGNSERIPVDISPISYSPTDPYV